MSTVSQSIQPPPGLTYGEPVWEIARLYPAQGHWTLREYLDLNTNQRLEFSHGYIEFLPMATLAHEWIVRFLFLYFHEFVSPRALGEVFFAGVRVQVREDKIRMPDLVFFGAAHRDRMTDDYLDGADLVMEVVSGSESDRRRDLVEKRAEYARAGIPEYWIVDPAEERIIVLTLDGSEYKEYGIFVRGDRATSRLLPGFEVEVSAVFDAGK